MYSDTLYLFGDKFIPEAKMLDYKEELPSGKKVNQKKLAELVTLAAFVYLKNEGYIDLFVKEGKILFVKTQSATAKRLKDASQSLGVLEDAIFSLIQPERGVQDIVYRVLGDDSQNPWSAMLSFVKEDLENRGIIEKAEKGKVLFIKTYKNVLKGEIPAEEQKQLKEFEEALEEFQHDSGLYEKTHSAISNAINSRVERDND